MAKMNFSLRPFVASKVLSPGTDNIRMSFDSKVRYYPYRVFVVIILTDFYLI